MIGSAGGAIVFVVSLAGLAIWSVAYCTFVGHYVLTTLTDTSAGANDVEFPVESWIAWWWKPVLCLWVLSAWCVPISILCLPLASYGFFPYTVAFGILLGAIYPLSLASVLYQQNWLMLFDALVVWRMLRHLRAFLYVLTVTSMLIATCATLLVLTAQGSWIWLFMFTLMFPMTFLMWARHWGRLSWLALNPVPSRRKRKRRKKDHDLGESVEDEAPEMDVEEVTESLGEVAPPPVDAMPNTLTVVEEDEWATDKAPYGMVDFEPEPIADEKEPLPIQKPLLSMVKYYDERANREATEAAEREDTARTMPSTRRQPPSFREAMFVGMWSFLLQRGAFRAWLNLAFMTVAGVLLLTLMGLFRPPV